MAETPAPLPALGPRTEAEILADPRLREPLAGYHPLQHETFLKSYARVLDDLHHYGSSYESNLEHLLHQHDKAAYRSIWAIQHQKLFDLECQWRTGRVEVPGARLTADFEDWHEFIENCRAVPPISPDELALLDAFLEQLANPDELEVGNPSRDFWMQRRYPSNGYLDDDEDDEDDESPLKPWTEFWDLRRGTGYLRALPDLRGEREHRYEQAVFDEHHRLHPYTPAAEDSRPHVPTWGAAHDALVCELLRRFEPAVKLRQFQTKQQLEAYDATEDRQDLPLALERLQNAGPVPVPIEAHADWRQAVMAAANRHYFGQLRAALLRVYEEYCQREAFGISHSPANDNPYRRRKPGQYFERHAKQIREGRRLLGEPDDLNF